MRTCVVTGAGGVLGAAVARRLAADDVRLLLVDRDEAAGDRTAESVRPVCDKVVVVRADVSDEDEVRRYAAEAVTLGDGAIDAFFNNAGIEGAVTPLVDYPVEEFDRVMAVNVRGVFLGIKHVAPALRRGGSIVNTASTGGLVGATNLAAYIASKHAVVGLTKAAALELAAQGIRVNAVCPGPIRGRMIESIAAGLGVDDVAEIATAKIPLNRMAEPDEVAETVAFLLSAASSYTTGAALPVDGGRAAG